jgi:hypothetical protein
LAVAAIADLAGARNLKKMGKVEFQVVKLLQSANQDAGLIAKPSQRFTESVR